MMLTKEQEAAVITASPRAVVMAGAGSGKTTLLTERVLHLIGCGEPAETIMPITFTRKAARELSERLGQYSSGMPIGTFHALCLRAMTDAGMKRNVLDEEQADDLLDECAVSLGLAVRSGDGVQYIKHTRAHWRKHIEACREGSKPQGSPLADTYLSRLSLSGDIDYSGIIYAGLSLAKKGGGFFGGIRHIIIDEAQDTTALQWRIVNAISAHASIMAVGDIAQSLFTWAGADPDYFASLPWERHILSETFRCPSNVADLCNSFPTEHVHLRSSKPASPIYTIESDDVEEVVKWLASEGLEENDIAVLCRYNSQVDTYRDRLSLAGWNVSQARAAPRGAAYRTLMYMSNMSSRTARKYMQKEWAGLSAPPPISYMLSDMDCSSVGLIVEDWLSGLEDNSVGAILSRLPAMTDGPYYAHHYGPASLQQFAIDASVVEPSSAIRTKGITVDTVHSTKGGEWIAVVLPDLHEWTRRTPRQDDWRVLHVAATRTKNTLVLMGKPDGFMAYCMDQLNGLALRG